ncbi:MAG: hypothetical protein HYX23_00890 [Candidatus Zambryskibacteria bacterium]|nr:hypothetical protein [Candidatus Zambryskibacteria bacterium]
MKKEHKRFSLAVATLAVLLAGGATASAVEVNVGAGVNVYGGGSQTSVSASATGSAQSQNKPATSTQGNATSSSRAEGHQGDEQKSKVSLVVKSLLAIADRDSGIGADIRLVAQEQASTTAQVNNSMAKVISENKVKVFLFGPDYKNLGELRSAIVTTQNHIARLKKAEQKTASASVKADLEV